MIYCYRYIHDDYRIEYLCKHIQAAIEAVDKDVDKGKAIRFLQNLLNISSEQTIVFGDGLNDIPLVEHARYKVAMDNAYPELKSKANLSSINNDRDGVIETLNTLLINDDNHSE